MKRLVIPLVAALALAGCGVAHAQGPAKTPDASKNNAPASGAAGASASRTPRGYLPVLSAGQAAAEHLYGEPWDLVRLSHGGTVAEISYTAGGCRPQPRGVVVTQSGKTVTLSLEALRLHPGVPCPADLFIGTAKVRIPALSGRTLQHASLRLTPAKPLTPLKN